MLRDDSLWTALEVAESTTSTNADVVAAARAGADEGLVVVAEEQAAGRGRLGRSWLAPPRAAVLMSVLVRPKLPAPALPLLPLLSGLAVVEATRAVSGVDTTLKWPNDVLVGDRKLGGILVERVDDFVVVGVGLNVSTRPEELAVPTATSVVIEGGTADREPLVKEILRSFSRRYREWRAAGGTPDAVIPSYRAICETIDKHVRIELPGERTVTGVAVDVDDGGRLVVESPDGQRQAWSAGDVTHVRRTD